MKILITGCKGQLGTELQDIIRRAKAEIGEVSDVIKESNVIALDVDELDITNLEEVNKKITFLSPDVVINCAAATNVDGCESNEDFTFKVNSIGSRNLAIASKKTRIFIHLII